MDFAPINLADLDALTELWSVGYVQGHKGRVPDELMKLRTPDSFRERLAAFSGRSLVAKSDGTILGFCLMKDNEIYQFYVAQAAQGTGAASALMQRSLQALADAGHDHAFLAVDKANARAIGFYEKAGFYNDGAQVIDVATSQGPFAYECFIFKTKLN